MDRREHLAEFYIAGDVVNVISPKVVDGITSGIKKPTVQPLELPPKASEPQHQPTEILFSLKNPENQIILHPDILLPMTSLAGALSCRRKPLIQRLVKER
jgi:hypothetical protein